MASSQVAVKGETMRKILLLIVVLIFASILAHAGPPSGGWCRNPGGAIIPIHTSLLGAAYPGVPPASYLYGSTDGGSTWYGLQCDANGNLSAGAILGATIPAIAAGCLGSSDGLTLGWIGCGGGGGSMTWPSSPGYALWQSGTSWSTPHLTDSGTGVASSLPFTAPSLVSGTPSAGALAALPTGAHGMSGDESSTAGVPAAGVDYLRFDSTSHRVKQSVNNGAEVNVPIPSEIPAAQVAANLASSGSTGVTGVLPVANLPTGLNVRSITFSFGQPGGTALTASILGYVTVPFACSITGWSIQVDAGTDTVKFLKVAAGTAIPTIGSNSINTSGVALASNTVIQSTTITDFTTATVTAGDIIAADLITTASTGYINAQLVCAQ